MMMTMMMKYAPVNKGVLEMGSAGVV